MTHPEGEFRNPLKDTKSPVMSVPAVLKWIDLEIEYLHDMQATLAGSDAEPHATLAIDFAVGHLMEMQDQLTNYAMQLLDEGAK